MDPGYMPPREPPRRSFRGDTTRMFVRLIQQRVNRGERIGEAARAGATAQAEAGRLSRLVRRIWPFGRR